MIVAICHSIQFCWKNSPSLISYLLNPPTSTPASHCLYWEREVDFGGCTVREEKLETWGQSSALEDLRIALFIKPLFCTLSLLIEICGVVNGEWYGLMTAFAGVCSCKLLLLKCNPHNSVLPCQPPLSYNTVLSTKWCHPLLWIPKTQCRGSKLL